MIMMPRYTLLGFGLLSLGKRGGHCFSVAAAATETDILFQDSMSSYQNEEQGSLIGAERTSPIIGILSTPSAGSTKGKPNENHNITRQEQGNNEEDEIYYYVAASYVKWLEASGARPIALPFYSNDSEEIKRIFNQINGILFPGGEDFRDMPNSTAPLFYKLAVEANNRGDHFPIWGTCLGFEYLVMLGASSESSSSPLDPHHVTLHINTSVLDTGYDAWNMTLSLDYTQAANHSRMYGSDPSIRNSAGSLPITMNNHHNGIEPQHFMDHPELSRIYDVLSTNKDRQGRPFVSSIEGRKYPFYGVQFHPEKNQFEYRTYPNSTLPYEVVNHSPQAVALSRHMSELFVDEARKNNHKFIDVKNYPPLYTFEHRIDVGGFQQIYVVEYADSTHPHKSADDEKDTGEIKTIPWFFIIGLIFVGLIVSIATIWALKPFCSSCPRFSSASRQRESVEIAGPESTNSGLTLEESKLDEPLLPAGESNRNEKKNVSQGKGEKVSAQILSV